VAYRRIRGSCPARVLGEIPGGFPGGSGLHPAAGHRPGQGLILGIPALGVQVFGPFVGRDAIALAEPLAEVDIGAAFGAERQEFGDRRLLADRAGLAFQGHDLGTLGPAHGPSPP